MSDLTTFLLERIAEQEAAARAGGHGWLEVSDYILREPRPDAPVAFTEARVLAECAAKRDLIRVCTAELSGRDIEGAMSDGDDGPWLADHVLHTLATPYADHPDYRAEWAL